MTMSDKVTVELERKDVLFLRDVLAMNLDMMVADREARNYRAMDIMGHINKVLEDALMGGDC